MQVSKSCSRRIYSITQRAPAGIRILDDQCTIVACQLRLDWTLGILWSFFEKLCKKRIDILRYRHRGRGCRRVDAADFCVTVGEIEERPNTGEAWALVRDKASAKCGQITASYPRSRPVVHAKKPKRVRCVRHRLVSRFNKNETLRNTATSIHDDYLRQARGGRDRQRLRL